MKLNSAIDTQKYRFFLLITCICGIISLAISIYSIYKHQKNQFNPWLQRKGLLYSTIPIIIMIITVLSILVYEYSWLLSFFLELYLTIMIDIFFFYYFPALISDQSLRPCNKPDMIRLIKEFTPEILLNFTSFSKQRDPSVLKTLSTKSKLTQLALIKEERYKNVCKCECYGFRDLPVENLKTANVIIKKVGILLIMFTVIHPGVNLITGISMKYYPDFSQVKILVIIRIVVMVIMWNALSKFSFNINRFCSDSLNTFAKMKIFQLIIVLIMLEIFILSLIKFNDKDFSEAEVRDFWLNLIISVQNILFSFLFFKYFGPSCYKVDGEEPSTVYPKESSVFDMNSDSGNINERLLNIE